MKLVKQLQSTTLLSLTLLPLSIFSPFLLNSLDYIYYSSNYTFIYLCHILGCYIIKQLNWISPITQRKLAPMTKVPVNLKIPLIVIEEIIDKREGKEEGERMYLQERADIP